MASKLDHALALIKEGFAVFPCEENGRNPKVSWRSESSVNQKTIRKWFDPAIAGSSPNDNIGIDCFKSGVTGIDIDVKKGKRGQESYDLWQKEYGWPATFIVNTPSGGTHLYYKGTEYRNSVEKIAPGVDVRGDGGFMMAPGSSIDGVEYIVTCDHSVADMPEWLKQKLAKSIRKDPTDKKKVVRKAGYLDIDHAKDMLLNRSPALENSGGDAHTYETACMMKELGIEQTLAIDMMLELWNPSCEPPWDPDDLAIKVDNAYRYGKSSMGGKTFEAEFEIPNSIPIIGASKKPPAEVKNGRPKGHAHILGGLRPANTFEKRQWVFGKMVIRGEVSLLIAMPGVGKTTFVLLAVLSKGTGRNLLGIDPLGAGNVAIYNNEDTETEMERRIVAACQYHGITSEDYYDINKKCRIHINGADHPLRIANRMENGMLKSQDKRALIDYLGSHEIAYCAIDPFSMTHGGAENKNEDILEVTMMYKEVAIAANCGIQLVHHTRKQNQMSSEGHSGNLDSARGASALGGVVRIAHTLDVVSAQESKRLGIEERQRKYYIILEQAKANMSAPEIDRIILKRHGEIIGANENDPDGESVGILLPVDVRALQAKSPTAQLVHHVESLVEEEAMSQADIARALCQTALYHEYNPRTLEKSIARLFINDVLTGDKGMMHREEINKIKFIKHQPFIIGVESVI